MLNIGIMGSAEVMVDEENTAIAMGSGELEVFATPAMIALMEQAASESIKTQLQEGETSVGTLLNVKHLSATPMGKRVKAETKLTEVDGRRLVFTVKAYDEAGLIGEGDHERFIVKTESFMNKINQK